MSKAKNYAADTRAKSKINPNQGIITEIKQSNARMSRSMNRTRINNARSPAATGFARVGMAGENIIVPLAREHLLQAGKIVTVNDCDLLTGNFKFAEATREMDASASVRFNVNISKHGMDVNFEWRENFHECNQRPFRANIATVDHDLGPARAKQMRGADGARNVAVGV